MVQSVELLIEPEGDAAIRVDWERLEALGLRTPARHPVTATRPHITLAVATAIPEAVEESLAGLRPALPLPLALGGLVIFGTRRLILARGVAASGALLDLQHTVAEIMAAAGAVPGNLQPDRWAPHLTLARDVDPEGLARALTVLRDRAVVTAAIALRRWDGDRRREWLLAEIAP